MNGRQRYIETLLFGQSDRIPLFPGNGRKSTLEAWHAGGLPAHITHMEDVRQYAYEQAGGRETLPRAGEGFLVDQRMIPWFEEKVLERRERTQIVQDWKGNICEIGNQFTVDYLRDPIDFVTRAWLRCPVETRQDFAGLKARYDPHDPRRLPEHPQQAGERIRDRDWPLTILVSGPFWQLREWLGFEPLCMLFYDDPAFVEEMVEFWEWFVAELLREALKYVTPDVFYISEDMAYKQFSMISPAMTRKFLWPTYQRWGEIVRQAGCPIYAVDSDGFIGDLIPVWLDAGVNVCDPIEVAALNDIVEFRQRFGRAMAYRGGVDKRAMARGGREIEAEMARLRPVIEDGGFIPSCDHGVPADVSWENFVYYVQLLAGSTGWL